MNDYPLDFKEAHDFLKSLDFLILVQEGFKYKILHLPYYICTPVSFDGTHCVLRIYCQKSKNYREKIYIEDLLEKVPEKIQMQILYHLNFFKHTR